MDLLAKEFELAKERQAEFLGDRYKNVIASSTNKEYCNGVLKFLHY